MIKPKTNKERKDDKRKESNEARMHSHTENHAETKDKMTKYPEKKENRKKNDGNKHGRNTVKLKTNKDTDGRERQ